jgi:phosphomannomutase
LVAVADYLLAKRPGATVSNLSSTRALRDITEVIGQSYHAAAVGEVNVVQKMKEVKAVIGGEGNGGIIYPELHYGRDSLVGIALFLTHFANKQLLMTALRASYPNYEMAKKKIDLSPGIDVDGILTTMANKYAAFEVDTTDGVKIYIEKEWVHLRKSNTEPIIRIYTESKDAQAASDLADKIIQEIKQLIA